MCDLHRRHPLAVRPQPGDRRCRRRHGSRAEVGLGCSGPSADRRQARARPMTSVYVSRPLPSPGTALLRAAGLDVEEHRVDEPPTREELLARVADKAAILSMLT